jgi:uncharacterized RDD family membrane protein YckC
MHPDRRTALDTTIEIAAPEYIVFRHSIAGPTSRLAAVFIDQMIVAFMLLVLLLGLGISGIAGFIFAENTTAALLIFFFLGFFLIYLAYFFLMEWLNRGRTLGKMALGLRVVSADGTALDVPQVLLRNLLRVSDMYPINFLIWLFFIPSYGVGLVSMVLCRRTFQRLGDLAAGTLVVREMVREAATAPPVQEESIRLLSEKLKLKQVPSSTFTQALNDFVARRQGLGPDRAREIATHIEPFLRRCFGAEQIECEPEELAWAAHAVLFQVSRDDHAKFSDDYGLAATGGTR